MVDEFFWITPESPIDKIIEIIEEITEIPPDIPVVDYIRQSLEALGYDLDAQWDRINSIITVLVASGEWDSDAVIRVMDALADGWITDAEVEAILAGRDIDKDIEEDEDDAEDDAKDDEEKLDEDIDGDADDGGWNWNPIDFLFDNLVLEPLEAILISVSRNLGERLERFIANAIGYEPEEEE